MEIPSEIIYSATATLGTAIVALWRRQVASEKRCQKENDELAKRLRQIEDFQRDKLFGLLTKAVVVLKAHGVEVDETPRNGHHQTHGSLVAAFLLPLLLTLGGCGEAPAPRGSAQDHAASAEGRSQATHSAADAAEADAAAKAGRAAELERQAIAQATPARIAAAADARVEAASARAVSDALIHAAERADQAAKAAALDARKEREAEAAAADQREWVRICQWVGLAGVLLGALIGGAVAYLASPRLGAAVGGLLAGTGLLVAGYGATSPWLLALLLAVTVACVGIYVFAHRQAGSARDVLARGYVATSAALRQLQPEVAQTLDEASRGAQKLLGKGVTAINDRVLHRARQPAKPAKP